MSILSNRWLIATFIMLGMTAATLLAGLKLKASALEDIRRSMRAAKADGDPHLQDFDIEGMNWNTLDFDMEVTPTTMAKITWGDLALGAWWLWGPVYLIVIFGLAWLSKTGQASTD